MAIFIVIITITPPLLSSLLFLILYCFYLLFNSQASTFSRDISPSLFSLRKDYFSFILVFFIYRCFVFALFFFSVLAPSQLPSPASQCAYQNQSILIPNLHPLPRMCIILSRIFLNSSLKTGF